MPPKRSTANPARAWPTPETTKKTLITAPTCVNERPNSRISITKSGGITKWKKCDVPWAKPTREMIAASWRRLAAAAGLAADMELHCILAAMPKEKRCPWCLASPAYVAYHDFEWGRPVHDDRVFFEFLTLEGAQAGLSWSTILAKRENYRRAFAGFD